MITDLDAAKSQSADHPDADQKEATRTVHTGRRGRLAEAGEPVYVVFEDVDGNSWQYYTGSGQNSSHSTLSDDELDNIMVQILELFPAFGRRMIDGI